MKKAEERKDITFVLKTKGTPLSTTVNTRHSRSNPLLYWDEKLGINRTLRYASNQKSVFEDEQDGNAVIEPIIINDGALFVPRTMPVLQDFMMFHPHFNKKWEILDKSVDAQEELDREDLIDEAIAMYKSLDINQIEDIARVQLKSKVDKMSSAEMKRDVRRYARNNPEDFLECVDKPEVQINGTAARCFTEKLLTLRNGGTQIWYNLPDKAKTKVMDIPSKSDEVMKLSEYFLTNEGIEVMKGLEKYLEDL